MANRIVVAVVGANETELRIDSENRIVCDCFEQAFLNAADGRQKNCRHIVQLRNRLVTRPGRAIAA